MLRAAETLSEPIATHSQGMSDSTCASISWPLLTATRRRAWFSKLDSLRPNSGSTTGVLRRLLSTGPSIGGIDLGEVGKRSGDVRWIVARRRRNDGGARHMAYCMPSSMDL